MKNQISIDVIISLIKSIERDGFKLVTMESVDGVPQPVFEKDGENFLFVFDNEDK
jgi:hypothetical protein